MTTSLEAVSEQHSGTHYDRLFMRLPGEFDTQITQMAAESAVAMAQSNAPKMTGMSSRQLRPVWGKDYFGVQWIHRRVWFQEMGIKPFVMNNLQGKVVPMWVQDRDGKLRQANPKIQKKTAVDGRQLVLIFRRAAIKGERKMVQRVRQGLMQWISVPRSYPGAPGRINQRGEGPPRGYKGGQILKGNNPIRWRHPGMASKFFIHEGILIAGRQMGFPLSQIEVAEQGHHIT